MKTYTLTEEELDQIVAERLAYRPQTSQGLFNEVCFEGEELILVNSKHSIVAERLGEINQFGHDPKRFAYTNKPKYNERMNETSWHTIGIPDIHNAMRKLVLHVFGKSKNQDLTTDEYELAKKFYTELKDWYVSSYDRRLDELMD